MVYQNALIAQPVEFRAQVAHQVLTAHLSNLENTQILLPKLFCAIGKYQDEAGQSSCKLCIAGTYTREEERRHVHLLLLENANASGSAVACPVGQYIEDEIGI